MLTAIIAILVFGFLIFIHEFGHYITARIFKVSITEFSIGMGPKLLTYDSKKTGIRYSVGILPIGGYVAMVGEDEDSDDPNAFNKKPAWQRFIITAAGATVNIVAGFLAMILIVALTPQIAGTTYAANYEDADFVDKYGEDFLANYYEEYEIDLSSRSNQTGLQLYDEITHVNGKRVKLYDELQYEIQRHGHEPVDLTVIRDGETVVLEDVSFPTIVMQGQTMGIVDVRFYAKEKTFFGTFSIAFRKASLIMRMCWETIFDLISGRYTVQAVSGPVGISSAIGDAAKQGFLSVLNITVLISINLGFMNLLPIPALDGGRLAAVIIEMITRKKLPAKVEAWINGIGFMILMLLSVVILFKDVFTLIF